jgi:SAM-dependent methyltransferase
MADFGFSTVAVDSSASAIAASLPRRHARSSVREGLFDIALAYGVFYYGTRDDMQAAVNEMHRVLRPGGHGFVKTRTIHDWRAAGIPEGEPEHGMEMTFLAKDDIPRVYAAFSTVTFETTATSFHQRERWDSDWLIQVTK